MKDDRLNSLVIMSIESEMLNSLDFDDVINMFALLQVPERRVYEVVSC